MQTKDRSYSFRAPASLADRLQEARRHWADLAQVPVSELPEAVVDEFHRRLATAFAQLEAGGNQSASIRACLEIFVKATERMREEIGLAREYEAWSQQDAEGDGWRRGAIAAAAEIWTDD
jgi:hypothetical protein